MLARTRGLTGRRSDPWYRPSAAQITISVAVALLLAPLGIVLYALAAFGHASSAGDTVPVVEFRPEVTTEQASIPAVFVATWDSRTSVRAPAWSGLVTQVPAALGDTLSPLEVVVQIDNIDRLGWHADKPFYRLLGANTTGEDVDELQSLLVELDLLDESSTGIVDQATGDAVAELSVLLGLSRPARVFDPGWIVHLPSPELKIAAVNIEVGMAAPATGSELFTASPELLSGRLLDENGSPLNLEEDWEIVVGDHVFPLSDNGDMSDTVLEEIEPFLQELRPLTGTTTPSATSGAANQPESEEQIRSGISVQRTEGIEAARIPLNSIIPGNENGVCVQVIKASPASEALRTQSVPIEVLPIDIQPGVVLVTGLPANAVIIANPGQIPGQGTCH